MKLVLEIYSKRNIFAVDFKKFLKLYEKLKKICCCLKILKNYDYIIMIIRYWSDDCLILKKYKND